MGDASHFKMHPTVSADLELDIFLENVGTTYPIILSNEMDIWLGVSIHFHSMTQ